MSGIGEMSVLGRVNYSVALAPPYCTCPFLFKELQDGYKSNWWVSGYVHSQLWHPPYRMFFPKLSLPYLSLLIFEKALENGLGDHD